MAQFVIVVANPLHLLKMSQRVTTYWGKYSIGIQLSLTDGKMFDGIDGEAGSEWQIYDDGTLLQIRNLNNTVYFRCSRSTNLIELFCLHSNFRDAYNTFIAPALARV